MKTTTITINLNTAEVIIKIEDSIEGKHSIAEEYWKDNLINGSWKVNNNQESKPQATGVLPEGIKRFPYFLINGVSYQSCRKAAKQLGLPHNSIWYKCTKNKNGFYIITE